MAKINKKWHKENSMPKHATTKQRIKWHQAHAKVCGCRPMPNKLQKLIAKKSPNKS